jgi:MtrB/PioB family decaheme-associated outer membrane protein
MRAYGLLAALLLVTPAGARAQEPATDQPNIGSVDFGGQFTNTSGDEARYQRYRDLRDGGLLDAFRYTREKDNWIFAATANHVGYRDQKYQVGFRQYGRFKLNFTWDQIPLNYSFAASDIFGPLSATPYPGVGSGEYRIDDAVQGALEAICPIPTNCPQPKPAQRQAALYTLITQQARGLDIRHTRDVATADATLNLARNTNLLLHFQNTTKKGEQPWSASFGFSAAVDLPGPVDHRTTDFGAAVEWANEKGMLKAGWDGSWFRNDIDTLTWDNPLRLTDFTYGSAYSPGDGTSQGRMDLWPDSSTNMISGTATYKLPGRSKVYGNVGFSVWDQNDTLLPFTINTAIPVIPLPRQTAEAKADVTNLLLGFTSRPIDKAWLNVRYKLYDFNNKTPEFPVHEYVRFDQVIEEFLTGTGSEPFSYTRHYFDADLSYSVLPFTAVRVGYSFEGDHRTFRQTDKTGDNTIRFAVDTTGWKYGLLRVQYDYSKRTGSGLDEEVFDCDELGRACPRQFDISDRNRNRFSVIGSATPNDFVAVNAQVGVFRDDRPDTEFGLLNTDGDFYSIGVDITPAQKLAFGINYGKDKYEALQKSRQANPGTQEFDTTRDWTTTAKDDVDTVYFYVDLLRALPKTDIRYSFDWMSGVNDVTYGLAANQTIFVPPAALNQLPEASQDITRSMLDVMYRINRHFGAGFGWQYEDYGVDDWAWNQATVNGVALNPPNQAGGQQFLANTRYLYRPYTGNTVFLRLRYFW